MKLANFVKESLHIFSATCGISMKFSGVMWLMIILKVINDNITGIHYLLSRYIF